MSGAACDLASEAEARLAAHADNSPLAIIECDTDYRIIRWSREATRVFGWTAAEVLGKRYDEFPIIHEDDLGIVVERMRGMETGVEVRNVSSNRNRRKDGTVIHCTWYNSALRDASGKMVSVYSQVLDRTSEVEALAALRERETELERQTCELAAARGELERSVALLETLLGAAPVGFALLDRGHRCLRVNQAGAELVGIPLDEIVGKHVRDLTPELGAHLTNLLENVWRTGAPVINVELSGSTVGAPSALRHWIASYYPVRTVSGEMIGVGAIGVDVTAQKTAEAALREADRRKDEFLAMLAHELRNPLAPVRNAVQLMRMLGSHEPQLERMRDLIDRQVTHMTRLIDDLLDVSRITRGKIALQLAPVLLADVIEEALEAARPFVEQHEHTLSVTLGADAVVVEADRARLVQVVGNLLTNAAKFTPRGGHITLVQARTEDGAATIHVRDTGIGIPKELQAEVFELFRQEETSLARSQGGLGIGLTLVRSLVELHGGRVAVKSDGRGLGSEFIVTLPALQPAAAPRAPEHDQAPAPTRASLQVLVVEDDSDAAESFKMLLQLEGHEVRVASCGTDALRLLDDFQPAIAFVDLGLPGMSGLQLASRLRVDPRTKHTVLVAVTGYGRDADKEEARLVGFDHHMTKPVDHEAVSALIAFTAPRSSAPLPSPRFVH